MSYKVELPETVTVCSRGESVAVEVAKIDAGLLSELLCHGLTQKVADAASAAKSIAEEQAGESIADARDDRVQAVAVSLMEKARQGLYDGEWTRRGSGGGGVDAFTQQSRVIVRPFAMAQLGGSKSPDWAKFTGLDMPAQVAKLDEWFDANREALTPLVDEKLAAMAAAAKAKRDAAKAVTISL